MPIVRRPLPRALLTLLLLSVSALLLPARVTYAATITVTTTADELNTNGACSLREAIRAANTNARVGALCCFQRHLKLEVCAVAFAFG